MSTWRVVMYTAFANAVYITIDSVYFINSTSDLFDE